MTISWIGDSILVQVEGDVAGSYGGRHQINVRGIDVSVAVEVSAQRLIVRRTG
jgi:hypothetical protein